MPDKKARFQIIKKPILHRHRIGNLKGLGEEIFYKFTIEKAIYEKDVLIDWREIESLSTAQAARDYVKFLIDLEEEVIDTYSY